MSDKERVKKINLIPAELTVPSKIRTLKTLFNKVNIILAVISVVVLLGIISSYIYFSLELKRVNLVLTDLKSQIGTLESNEQKLVLIKDRLSKINKIKTNMKLKDDLEQLENLLLVVTTLPETNINNISINNKKSQIAFTSLTTTSLNDLISKTVEVSEFKNVVLSLLNFNPVNKYKGELYFNN